jgi:hypothetical protein
LKKNKLNIIRGFIIFVLFIVCSVQIKAQVKIGLNPTAANSDAMLEIEATNKGFLLPRLALVSTTSAAPLGNFVKGMVVFDTVTVNDITPGMYYSDGVKWIKVNAGGGTVSTTTSVQKKMDVVAITGQTVFTTPVPITDANKIFLYRNGAMISFNVISSNTIEAEIASVQNDEIRIVQIF